MTEQPADTPIPAWDASGVLRPTGKLAVHRQGLRHPAISVFVLRGDRILIQQRAAGKYHTPGLWANTCCTHPHWGEHAADCAGRRLAEELGIAGLDLRHVGQVEYRADVPGVREPLIEHELVEVFVAEAPPQMAMSLDPAEVQAVRWVSLADLRAQIARHPQMFTPWLRIYLQDHADMIFAGSPLGQTAENLA
ncbi:isopentenyl-diphosphate delta-isomerase [Aliigemmobacter aestuarii]|uniref:Isopentenyl-diphosphate Delta-isomerase n=1 Tax=Aliigemmobacter aestuarii TaxID=1445661 RepID=A0A4S3MSN4_9RHOB|nr:isopentenyl-diphosphate delta-isomerase [Gemmobacter aestuarii]THD85590.1 isopentenyl-diphosphate delta-isomerase [Gemmobacter aestuarii]